MTTFLPEVTAHGLVLWRLRRSPGEQLWCSTLDLADELALTVQDPTTQRAVITETHSHIGSLINRAEKLQRELEAAGWQLIDVDLDVPDWPSSWVDSVRGAEEARRLVRAV